MVNKFYYLVPKDYNENKNLKNEFFIIDELLKKNIKVIPIFDSSELTNDADGLIFNSLNVILRNKKILAYAKKNNLPIFWWYFDTAKSKVLRKIRVLKIAKNVSIFFNKDKELFPHYISKGINPMWLDQGVPSICKFSNIDNYEYDLSFFGSYNKVHSSRTQLLKEIDKKFNLVIYTKDKLKFLKKGFNNVKSFVPLNMITKKVAKINLVLNNNYNSSYCWSNRIHVIIGSGGFSLVEDLPGLNNEYKNNEHCIYFKDKLDLFEKIDFWLNTNNSLKRENIRIRGYKYAHKQKSYKRKTDLFFKIITDYINNKHD